jgi:hypothetical protein
MIGLAGGGGNGMDANQKVSEATAASTGDDPRHSGKPSGLTAEEATAALVSRAERGDATVLPVLRELLDHRQDLWKEAGDLAVHARRSLIRLASGHNLMLAESLERKAADLRKELAGPEASPLERLLADRVVACWLQVSYWDAVQTGEFDNAGRDAIRRHQDSAHRRFETATKNLATVRKLLAPVHSPVEVATRLGGGNHAADLRRNRSGATGVGVEN